LSFSAPAFSLPARPQVGHSGHQFSQAPGRPFLHLFSSSRGPRRETECGATSSLAPYRSSSFVRARGRSLFPACGTFRAPRAGAVKPGRRVDFHLWLGVSRPGLTEPSTVPRSSRSGRHPAPSQHHTPVGREHCWTIPLPAIRPRAQLQWGDPVSATTTVTTPQRPSWSRARCLHTKSDGV
jgi:hypothetical protein